MTRIQHLINVSGGKDSTAVYLLAIESGRPFRAVFADTGNEHEETYEYVSRLHERTGGPKVEWVKADFTDRIATHREYILANWPAELMAGREGAWQWNPKRDTKTPKPEVAPSPPQNIYRSATVLAEGGTWRWMLARKPMSEAEAHARVADAADAHQATGIPFLDACIWKGFFPGRMRQFCTQVLKVEPIVEQIVLPMLKNGPLLQWLGIRAEESQKRSRDPRFNYDDTGCYLWRPILRWPVQKVFQQHAKHGLKPNPLYPDHDRVGCYLCINCKKKEVRHASIFAPQHIDKIAGWELLVKRASKYGESTFFPAMTDSTDSDHVGSGDYSDIHRIVEWSHTTRGGRQFGMFFNDQRGGGCTSDLGLCEATA